MEKKTSGEVIAGKNAVIEVLRAGKTVDTVYLCATEPDGRIRALAREAGAVVKTASRERLSELSGGAAHQGVVALCPCTEYVALEELLAESERKGKPPFLLIADGVEDPHNLGAILRTAEACGADGLLLPKRRSAPLGTAVYKTSAGAAGIVKIAREANLSSCVRELKKRGVWIFAADMEGKCWCELDFTLPCALIVGSEGRGVSRLLREECDFLASLPMLGQINSLNASVAAGILMYEVVRQRMG